MGSWVTFGARRPGRLRHPASLRRTWFLCVTDTSPAAFSTPGARSSANPSLMERMWMELSGGVGGWMEREIRASASVRAGRERDGWNGWWMWMDDGWTMEGCSPMTVRSALQPDWIG